VLDWVEAQVNVCVSVKVGEAVVDAPCAPLSPIRVNRDLLTSRFRIFFGTTNHKATRGVYEVCGSKVHHADGVDGADNLLRRDSNGFTLMVETVGGSVLSTFCEASARQAGSRAWSWVSGMSFLAASQVYLNIS